MKFGLAFQEYLRGEEESFLNKFSHVQYKRLKKVLKSCRVCRASQGAGDDEFTDEDAKDMLPLARCDSCAECDQNDEKFFAEITKEASEIVNCFSSRVRRLLNLHFSGVHRCVWRLTHCFVDEQQLMIQEGRMLLGYVTMNALAIRKILKKFDKIHGSVSGRDFKTKMQAKRIELLQSPWLIMLGAFYLNYSESSSLDPEELVWRFSCDLNDSQAAITMTIHKSVKFEYNLTCPICLDIVFNPYALGCGHLFCKSCVCSAASVYPFHGVKSAPEGTKCPVCRTVGVYSDAVHMTELDLLLKNSCKEYWKERFRTERAEMVKKSREYWETQAALTMGI